VEVSVFNRLIGINGHYLFSTISAYGPHGAIIHYRPSAASDRPLGRDSLYLVDSGGQYLDGTTDVTRVFHYGTPTHEQVARYTEVLQVRNRNSACCLL
jgi:Xaa-Pro aminopeptidase